MPPKRRRSSINQTTVPLPAPPSPSKIPRRKSITVVAAEAGQQSGNRVRSSLPAPTNAATTTTRDRVTPRNSLGDAKAELPKQTPYSDVPPSPVPVPPFPLLLPSPNIPGLIVVETTGRRTSLFQSCRSTTHSPPSASNSSRRGKNSHCPQNTGDKPMHSRQGQCGYADGGSDAAYCTSGEAAAVDC